MATSMESIGRMFATKKSLRASSKAYIRRPYDYDRPRATKGAAKLISRNVPTYLVNEPRIRATVSGGGWAKVTYIDPATGRTATFSMRANTVREALGQKRNRWYDPATAVYSKWIQGTRQGYLYSQRNQVEGMLKTALRKGDVDLAAKLEQVLKMDDEKVARFREEWEKAHTDVEIEDFYKYEETLGDGPTVWA